MAGASLFVVSIPVETEECDESVVSQSYDSSASENELDDTNNSQRTDVHKANSAKVKSECNRAHAHEGDHVSVSCDLERSHVVSAAADTNDTTAVRVSESNITHTDGMDDMKVCTEGICAINTFPEGVSPKKDGTGDESEMMDDAEKGKEESEKGRDGAELKEEQEAEGSLSEDSIIYTTECITLEQVILCSS